MIVYTLKCENNHGFEEWFTSMAAFDELVGKGKLACPECDSTKIVKAPMAPSVSGAKESQYDRCQSMSEAPPCAQACGGGCSPR
jgi:hypothetical protein